jgi:hypothetical protein
MALADYRFRQETLPGTQEALRLEPDSAGYYVRLAAIIQESNPVASTEALQRAVALNRWDSQSWVELGLRAEVAGDLAAPSGACCAPPVSTSSTYPVGLW